MSSNVGHEFVSQCPLSLRCVSELLQTEFHHVRTLRIMEGVYRRGMQEEVMLEAGVVHTIFPCLDQLMEWHSNFLSELLSRRKEGLLEGSDTNFTVRRIGDLLLRQVPDPATFPAPPHRPYITQQLQESSDYTSIMAGCVCVYVCSFQDSQLRT